MCRDADKRLIQGVNGHDILLRAVAVVGTLRRSARAVLVVAAILAIPVVSVLAHRLRYSHCPHHISVRQLVDGTVGREDCVSVSGYVSHEAAYVQEGWSGKIVTAYYYLYDDITGYAVVVEAASGAMNDCESEHTTLQGMTRKAPTELRDLIERDLPLLHKVGYESTSYLIVVEGEEPPNLLIPLVMLVVVLVVVAACLTVYLCPGTVFVPRSLRDFGPPGRGGPGTRATGYFHRLHQLHPEVLMAKRTRRFDNAVAGVVPVAGGGLAVIIGPIGILRRQWGILLEPSRVTAIEHGVVYGPRNRSAMLFHLQESNKAPRTLVISFGQAWGHSNLTNLLLERGFDITREPAQAGPTFL